MQHINDDMDDLLRNAAENYPLRTNSANWESVANILSRPESADELSPVAIFPASGTSKRYKYLLLLLLLPVGFFNSQVCRLDGQRKNFSGNSNRQ